MKKIVGVLFFVTIFAFGQNVQLYKVAKLNENSDKSLLKVEHENSNMEYLGEIEVQGFSNDDPLMFSQIYKKAKEIGANTYTYLPFETIDGTSKFDSHHYRLKLFFENKEKKSNEETYLYVFSSEKKQSINIDDKKYTFEPRSFVKLPVIPKVYSLSTRNLLGSSIKVQPSGNANYYFQVSPFKINSGSENTGGGLNIKTGDIVSLEESYALFLSLIYKEQKVQ